MIKKKKVIELKKKIFYLYYLSLLTNLYIFQRLYWKYLYIYMYILIPHNSYNFYLQYNLLYIYKKKFLILNILKFFYFRKKEYFNIFINIFFLKIIRLNFSFPLITVIN